MGEVKGTRWGIWIRTWRWQTWSALVQRLVSIGERLVEQAVRIKELPLHLHHAWLDPWGHPSLCDQQDGQTCLSNPLRPVQFFRQPLRPSSRLLPAQFSRLHLQQKCQIKGHQLEARVGAIRMRMMPRMRSRREGRKGGCVLTAKRRRMEMVGGPQMRRWIQNWRAQAAGWGTKLNEVWPVGWLQQQGYAQGRKEEMKWMQMGIQGGPTGIVVRLQRCQPQRTTQGLPLGLRVRVARSHQPRVSRV